MNIAGKFRHPLQMRLGASLAAAILASTFCGPLRAEPSEISIALQYGVSYLPLLIMKQHKLVEKYARAEGLGSVAVTWMQFGSGAGMNDALLSGSLDFASGGVAPMLTIWDKTRGNLDVRGVASLGSMPLYLNTVNPSVKSIKDFTSKDKIALPAVKVSIQAVILQMAAAKAWGATEYARLDRLTVSMKHPDAMAAMLSGAGDIDAHLTAPPFQEQELQDRRVRTILSSYDVLGGPSTLNSLYTMAKFRQTNPKAYKAVLEALHEAIRSINKNKKAAAASYVEEEKSKLSPGFVYGLLSNPEFVTTSAPKGILKYAAFMHEVKSITHMPTSWKDIYFPEIHEEPGD